MQSSLDHARLLATACFTALVAAGCATTSPDARAPLGGFYSAPSEFAAVNSMPAEPSAQESVPAASEYGLEAQAYPTGFILGAQAALPVTEGMLLFVRGGYNQTDRGSSGRHDDEQGCGNGLGLGVRQYFGPRYTGWLAGARVDLWYLGIDWKDRNAGGTTEGTTDVWVLQPTVEGGYGFTLGESGWRLDLTLALGGEINVATDGEDVGQGAILLGGVALRRSF